MVALPSLAGGVVERWRPLDERIDEGSDVRRKEFALREDDGDVMLRFDDVNEHLHEAAAFQHVLHDHLRKQRDPQAAHCCFAK